MKKLLSLLFVSSICLWGCLNSEEDVTINADGSGVYQNTMDMSGMFDMMDMLAAMDTSQNSQLKKVSDKDIDSSFSFKSFIDTVTSLTADEKRLFEKATMRMNINQKQKKFKMTMSYPFAKLDDLQKIIELQQSNKAPNPFDRSMGGNDASPDNAGLPAINKIMNITFKNGLIERKIDKEKIKDLESSEQLKDMEKAEQMLEAITFSSSFHLPRAAKNATGEKIKLSNDKKTITVNYSLMDVIKSPSSLEFKVEY
jgi:hypothetical protein